MIVPCSSSKGYISTGFFHCQKLLGENMYLRKLLAVLLLVQLLSISVSASTSSKISTDFQEIIDSAGLNDSFPVIILNSERPDIQNISFQTRNSKRSDLSTLVWNLLEENFYSTQDALLDRLYDLEQLGKVSNIKPLIIANGVRLEITKEVILDLSTRSDIYQILHDPVRQILNPLPVHTSLSIDETDELDWGVIKVNAPEVWASGFTGEGVLLAIIDTGVNYNHHDLADHLWDGGDEYPNHGYDFYNDDDNPMDDHSHGTHCAGSALGDGTSGSQTGVAPDATLMCLKVLNSGGGGGWGATYEALDFVIAQQVNVISISLGLNNEPANTRRLFREHFDLINIAGITAVVAAGNERGWFPPINNVGTPGTVPSPWRHPDEVEDGTRSGVITVGATNINDGVANFSSEGPVSWQDITPWSDYLYGGTNVGLIKPDISAPGVNIKSCDYQNITGYLSGWDGTSMATPHAAGVVALMLSKNLDLFPVEIDSILQTSAIDLGLTGKDNDYGSGRIDAFLATEAIITEGGTFVGTVSNFNTDETLSDVEINFIGTPRRTISDPEGNFSVNLTIGTYSAIINHPPYVAMQIDDIEITLDETTTLDIGLKVGKLSYSPEDVVTIDVNPSDMIGSGTLTIDNVGSATTLLEVALSPSTEDLTPFDSLIQYSLTETLSEMTVRGIVAANDKFYVSGSNSFTNPNIIYVLDESGTLLNSFEQPGDDPSGMFDLAFDGENLWGSVGTDIIELNPEDGSEISRFVGPFNPNRALAFDRVNNVLWIGESNQTIYAYNPTTGEEITQFDSSIPIAAFEYVENDSNDCNLYIASPSNFNKRMIVKMNTTTGEIIEVQNLSDSDNRRIVGFSIVDDIDLYFSGFVGIISNNTGFDDFLKIWQTNYVVSWVELDTYDIEIDESGQSIINIAVDATGFEEASYDLYIKLKHNTVEVSDIMPLTIQVPASIDQEAVSSNIPEAYSLDSIYPNPFNAFTNITFSVSKLSNINISIFDILGREVAELHSGSMSAGRYSLPLQMNDMSSGIYFVQMNTSSGFSAVKKIALVK
jgi:subtilisin family serine protease